ncbi:hypothetical protein [Methylocella silvestris]|uniref:Uncharacterized protein n=1 Tax=Methylocella silvestris TaxID=199596 RepID=A0A2J7TG00_METSI|nr:hypothetical protein [Methylocella silvestris]PNG25688.1 hypothetical protein CR492_12265 [Methylocella silvestris]
MLKIREFCLGLRSGLQHEIDRCPDERKQRDLQQALERLNDYEKRFVAQTEALRGRPGVPEFLQSSYFMIGACLEASSRIDRRLLPRIARQKGASRSANDRRKKAEDGWQKTALELAGAITPNNPGLSLSRISFLVEERWGGQMPVGQRHLYNFLRKQKGAKNQRKFACLLVRGVAHRMVHGFYVALA